MMVSQTRVFRAFKQQPNSSRVDSFQPSNSRVDSLGLGLGAIKQGYQTAAKQQPSVRAMTEEAPHSCYELHLLCVLCEIKSV
jgi:hypothetical protein